MGSPCLSASCGRQRAQQRSGFEALGLPLGPGSPMLTLASPLSEAFQLQTLALALSTSCSEGIEPFPQEGELVSGLGPCLVASSDDRGEHSCLQSTERFVCATSTLPHRPWPSAGTVGLPPVPLARC